MGGPTERTLDARKLEACAQALFRKRKAFVDDVTRALDEEPTIVLWSELSTREQQEYLDEAYLVLRTYGVGD